MDKELLEQFQMIVQGMADMETRLIKSINTEIQKAETRINIKIENDVTKRIFDGYKLTHEKQWELERETAALKAQVDDLQIRLAALENKIA